MSDPYERVKGGRLTFKGGSLATRSKSIDKKKKKTKNKNKNPIGDYEIDPSDLEHLPQPEDSSAAADGGVGGGEAYTIDAAKKMKYEELFPVETKKFGYQPKKDFKSVEEALDDRVKKKADRYCIFNGGVEERTHLESDLVFEMLEVISAFLFVLVLDLSACMKQIYELGSIGKLLGKNALVR